MSLKMIVEGTMCQPLASMCTCIYVHTERSTNIIYMCEKCLNSIKFK